MADKNFPPPYRGDDRWPQWVHLILALTIFSVMGAISLIASYYFMRPH